MKGSRFSCMLFFAAIAFFFTSCSGGGGNQTNTDTTTTASADTTMAAPAPANTIVTTPENMLVVIHKVASYAKWKPGYDAHDSSRLANGVHSYVIGRGLFDSNMVLVAMKIDDITKAKAFGASADLKKAMQKGGVVGVPTISYVTNTWQDTANVGEVPRAVTTFSVKDWDTWVKSFQDGKQERTDNGIMARVIGHDADNNKKVDLVTALSDTAKAFAYYKSDALKKRREASGVISQPKRFIFRIVQRY